MQESTFISISRQETIEFGTKTGKKLKGGEVIELLSDLGGGKTTFVSGLALGFGSKDPVASPSFTISYVYGRPDGKQLHHFDFYRLQDAGVVGNELAEVVGDENIVTVIEWGNIVHNVLPPKRIKINIENQSENQRLIKCQYAKEYDYLFV